MGRATSMKDRIAQIRRVAGGRFLFLLVTLLLWIGLVPFLERNDFFEVHLLLDIAFSGIFLSTIFAVSPTRRQGLLVTLLGLSAIIMTWVSYRLPTPVILTTKLTLTVLFLTYAVIRILTFIFTARRISRDVIFASIVVYLIIGLIWAIAYQMLEHYMPGSLGLIDGPFGENNYLYTYYSFVTLTTLGYGDVTPLNDIAGSFAIMEAIIGQLYMTVLVARLVGMHIAHSAAKDRGAEETRGRE